jgi:hypothetical protein
MALRISPDLALPVDWITLATVVYGARGSGKTSFGRVAAEEATKAGQRFCAIDLKGDWHGLKSSADGKRAGIPVVVFGGDHEDVPLEEGAGKLVGEIVAGLEQSCVLDFENISKTKRTRFLAEFFETLYHVNREPLLLFLDEAQSFAPQKPGPDEARTLGAVQDLVKLGRKHGIGLVLFTQRGAGLNKEVSELCDMLVAFRTPGPLDQERIKGWAEANATKEQGEAIKKRLASLPTGTAFFASGHPDITTFGVYAVRRPETFDSSATPKVGQRRQEEPKQFAMPDLEALRVKMADAIQRRDTEDPKALRKRIKELESKLSATAPEPTKTVTVEIPMWDPEAFSELNRKISDHVMLALNNSKGALHVYMSKCMESNGAKYGLGGTPRAVPAHVKSVLARLHEEAIQNVFTGTPVNHGYQKLEGWTDMEEALYQKFKARLLEELRTEPAILKILATAPELEVTVERQVIEIDGKTLRGRLAQLVAEDFFAEPRKANHAYKELQRIGFTCGNANVYKEVDNLTAVGILTKEAGGYRIAPGAKVNLKKAG